MKNFKILLALVIVLSLVGITGCSTDDTTGDTLNTTPEAATGDTMSSGVVTGSGSTSVEKIALATMDEFMALSPNVDATYEGIGSSGGVKNADEGTTEFGAASRKLKDEEKSWGMTEVVIAYDGIAVIVHPSNTAMNDITMDQILGIFKGEITDWSEVGGTAGPIVVVSREDGSGTRGAFEEIVGFEDELSSDAINAEGNGNVQVTVATNESAIGYVSFTYIDDTVKPLLVEGVEATVGNVLNDTFPISRPFIMMYHEENMSDTALAYIDFILSPEGQEIVEEEGGIPVN
jgi:phosphate transport system substrate-binding protein